MIKFVIKPVEYHPIDIKDQNLAYFKYRNSNNFHCYPENGGPVRLARRILYFKYSKDHSDFGYIKSLIPEYDILMYIDHIPTVESGIGLELFNKLNTKLLNTLKAENMSLI